MLSAGIVASQFPSRRRVAPTLPLGGPVAAFTLTSTVGGSSLPFAVGHVFKQGDVPTGSILGADTPVQVTPKNYWPDGSLKYAIISGRKTLTANVAGTVSLATAASVASGSSLTTADLKATGITASIACGAFGTVSWATTDWDSPVATWASGPEMSSWCYRKPVGSDPHLVGWLEVRLWVNGAVEVLPFIENGFVTVSGPTTKSATYSFTLGGSSRFSGSISIPHHARTPLASGTTFTHWLGTDPAIRPNHDKAYLQASQMVPTYRGVVAAGAAVWSGLTQTFTPLQRGNYRVDMGAVGYSDSIGLMPEWDVLYLCSNDSRAYAGIICNAYGGGRYAIHYRDGTTHQPIKFSNYPHKCLATDDVIIGVSNVAGVGTSTTNDMCPTPLASDAETWDTPHHPQIGYMAYLITGRRYFAEECQFVANIQFLKVGDSERNFTEGLMFTYIGALTPRGAAWALRSLTLASAVTPDSDALAPEYLASIKANVDYYYTKYAAPGANNVFGLLRAYGSDDYDSGDSIWTGPIWQEDFFTAATGWMLALKPALTGGLSNLTAFFAWKAQSIIGRLGGTGATEFLFCDAAQYTLPWAPSTDPTIFENGTGPFYANWGAIYQACLGTPNPGSGNTLRGGNYADATSYWGNLQPAIAYAVDHGVSGALAAYNRMIGASNWALIVSGTGDPSFNVSCVWSVKPRTV